MRKIDVPRRRLWIPRPEVTIENYDAVYDYYAHKHPNKAFTHFAHFALSHIFHPRIHVTHTTNIALHRAIQEGSQLLGVMNHWDTRDDVFNDAVFLYRVRALRKRIGNYVIPGEPKQFTDDTTMKKLERIAKDELGSYPVIRGKDSDAQEGSEERNYQRSASRKSRMLTEIKYLEHKHDVVTYAEGERGIKLDGAKHTEVRPFKNGLQTLIEAAIDAGRPPVILPFVKFYGEGEFYNTRDPVMVAGEPINGIRTRDAEELVGLAHEGAQQALTKAAKLWTFSSFQAS